jgi:hypothetical protein
MPPKVFVSHASEDKERFVLGFATKLRENGIDAWLDKWEMLPGDSLVDKIFEEGIKDATAVIVVLSKFSVKKPWVREELNSACVKRINNGSKLIPLVIDECEVPEALKSTLRERIDDLNSYQKSFDRIVASIFGATDKPPLGAAPEYTRSFSSTIGGLSKLDSLVLRLSCENAMERNDKMINPTSLFLKDDKPIVPEQELADAFEMLDHGGYIELFRTIGAGLSHYTITTHGFDAYARECIPGYEGLVSDIVSALVNKGLQDNRTIAEALVLNTLLVDHVFDVLETNGHIKQAKMIGGLRRVFNISPALRRALRQ